MGNALTSSGSKLERAMGEIPEPYYGLENFGNTCYCNSVLQALYFCVPFRCAPCPNSAPPSLLLSARPAPAPHSPARSNDFIFLWL